MSAEEIQGALSNLKIFEAIVDRVDPDTGNIYIKASSSSDITDPDIIPPIYYGGLDGTGLFMHPRPGDVVICARVFPGGKGITQGIRVIPKTSLTADNENIVRSDSENLGAGMPEYPAVKQGEVKIRGLSGKVDITGDGERGGGVSVGTLSGDGLHVKENASTNSAVTIVGNSLKVTNDATRVSSRNIYRYKKNDPESSNKVSANSYFQIEDIDRGKKRGTFPGLEASESALLSGFRNPGLSEYRFVANEFSETDYFEGWDNESGKRDSENIKKFATNKLMRSLSFENALHLAPHQLVEVVIGNVVNSRGEALDINYGSVVLGNALGLPVGDGSISQVYEDARLKSRRSIGYHFQLSTNSLSAEISNDMDNFVFAVDKEGVLKANIPASSNTGNVLYPTAAEFYQEDSGKVKTEYAFDKKREKIPITLAKRAKGETAILYPSIITEDNEIPERYTGVRFSNENNYFKGFSDTADPLDAQTVRVNPTKHHNMYAAAEMLIANKVVRVNVPVTSAECTGYIAGTSIRSSFEIRADSKDGKYTYPNYMSTVTIAPDKPAIGTGGGTVVAGLDYSKEIKFANSFTLSEGEAGISARNISKDGEERSSPGGKSANINLEGSLELSVGKDNFDQKSILLDTAGGMVAWFGKDKNGRSIVAQTDGSVLLNVGGMNGDTFNKGSFDLRVNVSNKGWVGDEREGINDSDYLISISENGLVIAGMKKNAPMIIRNDGDLMIESSTKLILSGMSVAVREGCRPERKTHIGPESADTPEANEKGILEIGSCYVEAFGEDS